MEIDKVKKVHSIGNSLKDSKVTVNQDFKFNVAGIKIEGTTGEVNNMPQWVGKILSENKLVTMDSPNMLDELKQALSKESSVGLYEISSLEPHFYIKLKEFMKQFDRDDFNRIESMMMDLFRMRRGKLITLADSGKLNSELYNKLTVEENIFFKIIHNNSVEFEKQIRGDSDE